MSKRNYPYPEMSKEKKARLQDLWKHSRSSDGIDPEVASHLQRMGKMGGVGLEVVGNLNKDYLGGFMSPYSRDCKNADLVIVGQPLEKAAPMNASHKYGPKVLREFSKNAMGTIEPNPDGGWDIPFDTCRIIDYGNIDTYGRFDLSDEVSKIIQEYEKIVLDNDCVTFTWGGDHTISYAPINVLGRKFGPLSLIHFDAHYDLVTFADFNYPYHSGNQFTKNMAEGYLDPERMITMGIRGRMTALVGGHAKNFGVTTYTADQVFELGTDKIAERILEVVGDGPTYFTLDLDSLDATDNASNSAVEPFGLKSRQIWDIIRYLRKNGDIDLVGADVCEYAPYLDSTHRDAYIACGISWKLLCWLADCVAKRKGEKQKTEWPLAMGKASL
ncbi:arginase family protein [Microbulbifer variabilis]|jgi:arginase family enzyme|uniref:Arginase family protein n=1 Tax=Microbulbifer variabilis TaxID=266805 RepID=A0ABY4V8P4_9GAMM|nr:arginase family protein [Microbulbifer variabilis]USD19598.1 arginase family protein [Microbulbifer variabilis]